MDTQTQNTYNYTPDVLDLIIDETYLPDLEVTQIEMAFGKDDRKYVYFKGVLLGELIEATKYYEGLEVNVNNKLTVSLTPAINKNKKLVVPVINEFENILLELLGEMKGWTLICERDCDQENVMRYSNTDSRFIILLSELFNYCKNGNNECPTFLIQS
jgi:hypothetical protein